MLHSEQDEIDYLNGELRDAEKLVEELSSMIEEAIDILDGNKEPIDWRDKNHPELLRKLCEHLENYYDARKLNS